MGHLEYDLERVPQASQFSESAAAQRKSGPEMYLLPLSLSGLGR